MFFFANFMGMGFLGEKYLWLGPSGLPIVHKREWKVA